MAYVTSQELQTQLESLAHELGISVQELLTGYVDTTTYQVDKDAINARLDAIDKIDAEDGVETIAEKVASINAVLSNESGEVQGILDLITQNAQAIADETTARENADANLQSQIDAITGGGTGSVGELETRVTSAEGRLDSNETNIANNATAIADETTRASQAEADLQSQIDGLQGAGLEVGVICGKKAVNSFRAVFGQTALDTSDCFGTDGGTDGGDTNMGDGGGI